MKGTSELNFPEETTQASLCSWLSQNTERSFTLYQFKPIAIYFHKCMPEASSEEINVYLKMLPTWFGIKFK